MSDLISRQALKDAMYHKAFETDSDMQKWDSGCWIRYKLFENTIDELPSAEQEEFEWCYDCKEYDQKAHCCHRWTKCIRQTIEEIKSAERTGHWIIKGINTFEMAYGSTGYEPVYECSNCGGIEESYLRFDEPIMPEDADFPNYCPNCGCRMKGEEDVSESN